MNQYLEYLPVALIVAYIGFRVLRSVQMKNKLPELKERGAVFVDVRSPGEFASACAECSINIPLDQIKERSSELPKDKPIVVCCASGGRSAMAMSVLKAEGFPEVINAGSWSTIA